MITQSYLMELINSLFLIKCPTDFVAWVGWNEEKSEETTKLNFFVKEEL